MSEGPAAAAAAPPATTPAKDKTTDYVVLFKGEDAASGSAWFVAPTIYSTRTPKKAIEAHMKKESLKEGEFVAVPKRHWVIEEPKIVTTERLAF